MSYIGINNKSKVISFLIILLLLGLFSFNSFAKDDMYVLKLAHHHNVGGVADVVSIKFAELVEEKSNGQLKIQIFPGAQLGQEREAAEGVLMGTLDIAFVSSTIFADLIPGYGLDSLPFLFSEDWWENVRLFNDSPIGKELDKRMLEKGGVNLGWGVYGARHMYFRDKDVKTLEEMKGLKMRAPEVSFFIKMFEVIGARPTAITWGETYTAMQTGVVDGMESPLSSIVVTNLQEVAKYLLETSHMWATYNLVVSTNHFNKLPENLQDIVLEAGKEAFAYVNQVAYEEELGYKEFLQDEGMIFNTMSDEDRIKFIELTKPIVEKWAKENDALEIIKMIQEMQQ